jgi:hypothetical protein
VDATEFFPHRQRRELQRTGTVWMVEGGVTTQQITSIFGHKIDHCQDVIDTYLPRRAGVAIAAASEGARLIQRGSTAEPLFPRLLLQASAAAVCDEPWSSVARSAQF